MLRCVTESPDGLQLDSCRFNGNADVISVSTPEAISDNPWPDAFGCAESP
jgi:hypothetical protein